MGLSLDGDPSALAAASLLARQSVELKPRDAASSPFRRDVKSSIERHPRARGRAGMDAISEVTTTIVDGVLVRVPQCKGVATGEAGHGCVLGTAALQSGEMAALCSLCNDVIPTGDAIHACRKCRPWHNVCSKCAQAGRNYQVFVPKVVGTHHGIRLPKTSYTHPPACTCNPVRTYVYWV